MPDVLRLAARSIGPFAARAFRANANGEVVAAFERSFYARFGGQLVCIGNDLPDGPINALCAPTQRRDGFAASLREGDRVHTGAVGNPGFKVALDVGAAAPWRPEPTPRFEPDLLRAGLRALTSALLSTPSEGLAELLRGRHTPLILQARRAVDHLDAVVSARAPPRAEMIAPLVGLGPGLTPSGDDYLGGVLIALASVAREETAQAIWTTIAPIVPSATNAISAAHLSTAAEGLGSAPLHAVIATTMNGGGERLMTSISDLTRIGHTSGWDALAGAVAALTAVAETAAYSAAST